VLAEIDTTHPFDTITLRIKPNLLRAAEILIEQDLLFLIHGDPEPISTNQALNLLIGSGLAHLYNGAESQIEDEENDLEPYRLMAEYLDSHPDVEFVSPQSFPDNPELQEYLKDELQGHKTGKLPRQEVKRRYAEICTIVPQLALALESLDPLFNCEPVPV
jgi:hypothetical protein